MAIHWWNASVLLVLAAFWLCGYGMGRLHQRRAWRPLLRGLLRGVEMATTPEATTLPPPFLAALSEAPSGPEGPPRNPPFLHLVR